MSYFTSCHEYICLNTLSSIRPLTSATFFLWTFAKLNNVKQIKEVEIYRVTRKTNWIQTYIIFLCLKPYCKLSCLMSSGETITLQNTFCNCDKINSGPNRGRHLAVSGHLFLGRQAIKTLTLTSSFVLCPCSSFY